MKMKGITRVNEKNYNGANWVRVDLHLHSPNVDSFRLPAGFDLNSDSTRRKLANEYVKKLEESQITIAAITDYNEINKGWFELIKEEAQNEGIVIFPGVELSLKFTGGKYGLHLLLIFEKNIDIDGLNRFLHSLDKNPQAPLVDRRNHRDIESKMELEELIKEVRAKYDCLVIFPHLEDDKGLLSTYNPSQCAKYLMDIKPDAIEYISDEGEKRLRSTNELPPDYFKKIAIIENSDPKCLDEIGAKQRNNKLRVTYYKLSSFAIEALKIALHDPEVRIRTYKPPSFFNNRISKIVIKGSSFLRDIEIYFNPELNTFIGGRGVGKSAIIETIRYVMDLPIYAEKSERIDFINSVVGSGGEVSVLIDRYYGKEKKEFEIKRIIGKEPEIYERGGVKTGFSVHSLFEEAKYPIIIGQKELYYLSMNPVFQLQLIDELIGEKVSVAQNEFKKLIEQLKNNERRLLSLKEQIGKIGEYEQRLKGIESQIKVYEDLGVKEKLKRWTDIIDDGERLKGAIENVNRIKEEMLPLFDENLSELSTIIKNLKTGKSENKNILEKASEGVNKIKEVLEQNKEQFFKTITQNLRNIAQFNSEWEEKKKIVETEIQKIKRELGEEGLEPDKLDELTSERAKLIPIIVELKKRKQEIETLEKDREKIKDELGKKIYGIFNVRKEQIEIINNALKGRIKIEIKYEDEKNSFVENLTKLFKGSGVSGDAIDALVNPSNKVIDGLSLSQYIRQGSQRLREEFNLTPTMSNRILEWFKEPARLYELETLFPEDKIEISLKVNDEYKIIEKLSVGQKATALLLLLFAQEDRIIILDQPEEDLDNRFIYENVVKILREMKGKRQLLIATHNANIPVLGDSELILVLESQDGKCAIIGKGSIDKEDIKLHVKNIMEGGEEAFRIRAEKYGGI